MNELFSPDSTVRFIQYGLIGAGTVAAYCVFFTLRDALLRSRSILFHIGSLLLVTALPVAGFFLYLLVRPARTIKEREAEAMLRELVTRSAKEHAVQKIGKPPKPGKDMKSHKEQPAKEKESLPAVLFASEPVTEVPEFSTAPLS